MTMSAEETKRLMPISEEMKEILRQNYLWFSSNGKEGRRAELERPDMAYTMFASRSFDGAEIIRANMHGSCFNSATFRRARLHGSDFRNADLTFADFTDADLRGVDFHGVDLFHARFDGACLEGARFFKANLSGADFRNADLTGTTFSYCGFPHDTVNGAKVGDNIILSLLQSMSGLDTFGCSDDIRAAMEQINTIFANVKAERKRKQEAAMEAFSCRFLKAACAK